MGRWASEAAESEKLARQAICRITDSLPPAAVARIHAQKAEMDRQVVDGTFGHDAETASELERKLLG